MVRFQRLSVAGLAALAVLPALLLGAVALFAGERRDDAGSPLPAASTVVPTAPVALTTPLLSARRAPTALATSHRRAVLGTALAPLAAAVDNTSCLAVGTDDQPVVSAHATVPVIPASNLKLVVAAAAVDILGADTVFTTKVVGPAPVGGVVRGDVFLVGGGDPVLSEQWYTQPTALRKRPPLHATAVEALVDSLKAKGITSITGRIVGDGSRYDGERHPPGWGAGVIATPDGVPVGALVIDDSTDQRGVIAADPAAGAAGDFTQLLRDRGVKVGADAAVGTAPPGATELAAATSQALPAMINEMLATSDNLSAEMMVKEIGVKVSGKGTRVDGLKAISDRLAAWGIPASGMTLVDGSGLSRENRLTCAALLAVLEHDDAMGVVGAGLALADQGGSTLDGRFQQPGLAGVLQGKTGTLRGVKALSGYFPTAGGEVEFVLILNGTSAATFAGPWGQLGTALLATTSSATPDQLAPRT